MATWVPGSMGQGQHEASASRGPVQDRALLQGTAISSSAISQALDDKNSLFQQQAKSRNIGQFPVSVSFILVANGRIWLLNHKNLNECVYLAHTQIIFYNANDLLPHLCCF